MRKTQLVLRLRNATPKGSTKSSECPGDKDCTATVTLDTEIPSIITKEESKTIAGRTRSKDTTAEKRLSETRGDFKSSTLTDGDNSSLCCGAVKRKKRSLAESECDFDSPRNKRLRIEVADKGPNTYQDFEPEGYSESATDDNLVDDNLEMAYIPAYPESEHEMVGEDELESEGGGGGVQ